MSNRPPGIANVRILVQPLVHTAERACRVVETVLARAFRRDNCCGSLGHAIGVRALPETELRGDNRVRRTAVRRYAARGRSACFRKYVFQCCCHCSP